MFSEAIYTIEEVAQHFRVPVAAIQQEIAAGRLSAFDVAGHPRIGESALNSYKNRARTEAAAAPASAVNQQPSNNGNNNGFLKLHSGADFTHRWPDKTTEDYSNVHEGIATYEGRTFDVKVGFTIRAAAGKPRIRSTVLIGRYATVEFAGADDQLSPDSMVASVIKDRTGKLLPANGIVPPEYQGMPLGSYRDVVDGPGAAYGMAVVCPANDLESIVKHALIRTKYREERG